MRPKTIFLLVIMVAVSLLSGGTAQAKVYIDLAAPAAKKLPLAVTDFVYTGPQPGDQKAVKAARAELDDALKGDLRFSALFNILKKEAYLDEPAPVGSDQVNFRNWRSIGADALIRGGFSVEGDKLTVEIRFFDCIEEKTVLAKRYSGTLSNPRRIVHYFTDQLYQELTGRRGVFSTRLAFVSDRTGNKEIYVSDYDGKNLVPITHNKSINLTPQWSPDGKKLLYSSYKRGRPQLFLLDLATGHDTVVSDKPGLNIGARFSPDGGKVALTLSIDKSPELYLMDLNTREAKKLTDNFGIDVSPAWAPDGKKLVYVSDMAGNPHIYMLDLATGNSRRLTFSGKYNSSPAWSPDGTRIAFSRADGGNFNIWVMQPDGSGMTQLTFEGSNRSPSWSPDARHIIYSSTVQGNSSIYIINPDGSGAVKVETGAGNERYPAWSPYMD